MHALRDRVLSWTFCWLPLPQASQATTQPAVPRLAIGGTVVRADGSPWAGADVVLHSLPWGLDERIGLDHIETTTDEHGSFSARVLPTRSYSVWALSRLDGNGRYRVSGIVPWLAGSGGLSLRESPETTRIQVRVTLAGRAAWRDLEPLILDGFCMLGDRLTLPCAVAADGAVLVPRVPTRSFFLRVRGRNGLSIASGIVPVTEKQREALLSPSPPPDPNDKVSRAVAPFVTRALDLTAVTLPEPRAVVVKIVDLAGRPIAGAELSWRDRAETGVVARSDEHGMARFAVPSVERSDIPGTIALALWVQAPGCILGNWHNPVIAVGTPDREPGAPDAVLSLPPGHRITGRVLWRPGQPAAGLPLFLHSYVPSGNGGGFPDAGSCYGGESITYRTDADGRFVIPGRRGNLEFQISTFLTPDEVRMTVAPAPFPMSSRIVLASGKDPGPKDQDLGDIVLSTFQAVDVQLVATDQRARARHVKFRADGETDLTVGAQDVDVGGRLRILKHPQHVIRLDVEDQRKRGFRIPGDLEWKPGVPVRIELEGR